MAYKTIYNDFGLQDQTTAAYNLKLLSDSNATALTAHRNLTVDVNNDDRILDFKGDLALGGDFTTTSGNNLTLTTTGATNITLPTSGTLATQAYVDAVAQGLDVKNSCRLSTNQDTNWTTSASITFSSPTLTITGLTAGASLGLIDLIEPVTSNRILIKDAGAAFAGAAASDVYNGLWEVTGGTTTTLTLIRTTDADSDEKVTAGLFTFIEEGTCADCGLVIVTNDVIIVNTTAIVFSQFSSAGEIIAGDGIDKTGSTISVDLKANGGLVIESTELALDLGATTMTGTLAVGDGGTGATTLTSDSWLKGNGTGAVTAIKMNSAGTTAPTVNEDTGDGYTVGSIWLDTTNNKSYVCLDNSTGAAVWNVQSFNTASHIEYVRTFTDSMADGNYFPFPGRGAVNDTIDDGKRSSRTEIPASCRVTEIRVAFSDSSSYGADIFDGMIFTVRKNAVDTALTLTMLDTNFQDSATGSISYAAGDFLSIRVDYNDPGSSFDEANMIIKIEYD